MINLNEEKYSDLPLLTSEELFKIVEAYDVFRFYIGHDIDIGRAINSPLRRDSIPSFAVFYASKNNILMYKDFASGDSGDAVKFVSKMFNLGYFDAVSKIAGDFGVAGYNYKKNLSAGPVIQDYKKVKRVYETKVVELKVKRRPWNFKDKEYWKSFGIKKSTLEKYRVSPVSHVFFNDYIMTADSYAYCYMELKDNKVSYKIYQPYSKKNKWLNNANYSVHQGYTQLPESGNLLVITKSLKDVMSLLDVSGISSVAVQAESVTIKDTVMQEYQDRFTNVLLLFDNDEPGIKASEKFSNECCITPIYMPKDIGKDFSDVVKAVGKYNADSIIKEIICGKLESNLFV